MSKLEQFDSVQKYHTVDNFFKYKLYNTKLPNELKDYAIDNLNKKKKVKFIPCQYQKAPPNVSGRNVLICDFSLKFEVTRSNKKILLSKKEFALLEFLLKHKNSIKSKEEIIQSIWNYDDDILPNTVEVYINYLREKIDKPFKKSKKLITTVRGFGYKISDE